MAVDYDASQVVDGLVGAIKNLTSDANYKIVADVFHDALYLREQNTRLSISQREMLEEYRKFRNELEANEAQLTSAKHALEATVEEKKKEIEDLSETKARLEGELAETNGQLSEEQSKVEDMTGQISGLRQTLEERGTEIENLNENLKNVTSSRDEAMSRADELDETLTGIRDELRAKSLRLGELEGYTIPLKDEPEDEYVAILDTIWTGVMGLVEAQFSQDLEDAVLMDSSCWSNLRSSRCLRSPLPVPLPQSNSPAAKQMRIAAVLAVLSRALHRHLFRPTYLLEDEEADLSLTQMLHELEHDSPSQEMHARSTLLAVLPRRQQDSAKKRVQSVVREVSWLVQHLLSALQYDAFCSGLEAACARACTQWMRIQEAQMKIEPYFGPPYDDFDWQVLPLPRCGAAGTDAAKGSGRRGAHRRNDSEDVPTLSPTDVRTDHGDDEEADTNDADAGETGEEAEGGAEVAQGGEDTPAGEGGDALPAPEGDAAAAELDGEGAPADGSGENPDAEAAKNKGEQAPEGGDGPAELATAEPAATELEASKPGDAPERSPTNAGSDTDEEEVEEVDPSEILLVVWPSLCAVEGGEMASITQGLVITRDQARAAFDEVRPRQGSRSRGGKKARTMSIHAGHSRSGSPRRAFLLAAAGAGSDDG